MRAIVVEEAGPPEVFRYRDLPRPEVKPGWILIRIRAFGLNRSEMYTRQGHSPSVKFPRVLGIECVGEVVKDGDGVLQSGQRVAAVMGEMGRAFDGGYAEYTCVPATQVLPVDVDLDWPTFAALPETFLTAWGALHESLEVAAGQTLLVRGGTSSVGMAAITLARALGLTVLATTRNPDKVSALKEHGADHTILGGDEIAEQVREIVPEGVDRVLDLVGVVTVADSLRAARRQGVACLAGILGGKWEMAQFYPAAVIPTGVKLTYFGSSVVNRGDYGAIMQRIVDGVARGNYRSGLYQVFGFKRIVDAHRLMETDGATGKLVVTVD